MEALKPGPIEWGVAAHALPGEGTCGDAHVVRSFPGGALVAALDGVGHGEEAASAARIASAILEAHADEPVVALFRRCHLGLAGTRGVVMSVASFGVSPGLVWLGVGNVQGVLVRRGSVLDPAEESLLLRSGVVGAQLPTLDAAVLRVEPGDTLVLATDGIDADFDRDLARSQPPQRAAETILAHHGKATDDALVLVARYRGGRS
jgi:hypothetical protein